VLTKTTRKVERSLTATELDSVLVVTEAGTILYLATMQKLTYELEAYLQAARTGIDMPRLVNWNSVAKESGLKIEASNSTKILSFLEKSLHTYITENAGKPHAAADAVLDPVFMKDAPKRLHKILKEAGNESNIKRLALKYAVLLGSEMDKKALEALLVEISSETAQEVTSVMDDVVLDFIEEQIKLYTYKHPGAFGVGRGPSPSVYRLQDEKGKATGMEMPVPGASTTAKPAGHKKWTKNLGTQYGLSHEQFYQAKKSYKLQPEDYISSHDLRTYASSLGKQAPISQPSQVIGEEEETMSDADEGGSFQQTKVEEDVYVQAPPRINKRA
jgi:hypothetical protein